MRKEFKRSKIKLFFSLLGTIIGTFIIYLILRIFIQKYINPIIPGIIIFLLLMYSILFSDNIKFIIENDILYYYKNNKLVKEYDLNNITISRKETLGSYSGDTLNLYINSDCIDCEPLGYRKFIEFYEVLLEYTDNKPIKLEVEKKG